MKPRNVFINYPYGMRIEIVRGAPTRGYRFPLRHFIILYYIIIVKVVRIGVYMRELKYKIRSFKVSQQQRQLFA